MPQLLREKDIKGTREGACASWGLLMGIAVYSTVKNGIGFFTLLPLLVVFIIIGNNRKNSKALEKEINARNMK